jgi:hypothetical protein
MNAVHFFVEQCSLLAYIVAVNIVHNRSRQMFKTVMTNEKAGKRVNRLENAKAERLLIDAAKAP